MSFAPARFGSAALALASCVALGTTLASAQSKEVTANETLFATAELIEGGWALDERLFRMGWPTDQLHRRMTRKLAAEPGESLIEGYLASEIGPSVARSTFLLNRREERNKGGEDFEANSDLVGDDLRIYRHLSNFRRSTGALHPLLFPHEVSKRELRRNFSANDFATWAWRPAQGKHTLESLGLAMLAEARYARTELGHRRTESQGGKSVSFFGRSERSGLMGLVALQAACAKAWELRHRLIFDSKTASIGPKPGLSKLDPLRYYFPQAWTSEKDETTLKHTIADSDGGKFKSRLRAQAAVLLGVSTLAKLVLDSGDEDIEKLFGQLNVKNQRVHLLHPDLADALLEIMIFSFQSIRTLHISVSSSGARAATLAEPGRRGGAIDPSDMGMLLMAVEAFVALPQLKTGDKDLMLKLADEQGKARKLCDSLGTFAGSWVNPRDPGAYDSYEAHEGGRATKARSLLSQGMLVRGLIAAHRITASGASTSPHLSSARKAMRLIDERFWDRHVGAYVTGGKQADLYGSASLLCALRQLAIATGDGRYLLRYRLLLERLHGNGWYEHASGNSPAGLLPKVTFTSNK